MKGSLFLAALTAVMVGQASDGLLDRERFHIGTMCIATNAQTESHIRDLAECGIDWAIGFRPGGSDVYSLCAKYGIDIVDYPIDRWWPQLKDKGDIRVQRPMARYREQLARFKAHPRPAVRMISLADEPSALEFPYLGEVARFVNAECPASPAFVNLNPSYAVAAECAEKARQSYLGTVTYQEYIDAYCRTMPLPYICYDFYVYMYTLEKTREFEVKMYENYQIVADACRRTGRDFWYKAQANNRPGAKYTITEGMLRYQAFSAMAYGAVNIGWACWTPAGWWKENVLDEKGERTPLYDQLKRVNLGIRRMEPDYMAYRNVDTTLVGYGFIAEGLKKVGIESRTELSDDVIRGLKAEDGSPLAVGTMMPRRDDVAGRAYFVFAGGDVMDSRKAEHTVVFATERPVSAIGPDGVVSVRRGLDGCVRFDLNDNAAVLVIVGEKTDGRTQSHTRGNAGMTVRYDIETAAWIAHPACVDSPKGTFARYRCDFEATGEPFEVGVSADERYVLCLDGEVVSRGPDRGTVESWTFKTCRLQPARGPHVLEATVWTAGPDKAPRQQLSWRSGFILKASGQFDARLSTGRAPWKAGLLKGTRFTDYGKSGAFGGGAQTSVTGTGFLDEQPAAWTDPAVVMDPQQEAICWGVRRDGWLLSPSALPDQLEHPIQPGELKEGTSLTGVFAARTKTRLLWDLGDYYCGYPVLGTKGGKGAKIVWQWAESLKDENGKKRDRNAWKGKRIIGFGDTFLPDGRAKATFTAPWWRCGRWCELVVETADDPLEISDVRILETRYPLAADWTFESSDKSLDGILAICRRGLEACSHETIFDCPYFEQQMYPGDGRVVLKTLGAFTRDRRLTQRSIELFDFGRRNDGFVPMNFPCCLNQESATYSMCYAMMYGDLIRAGGYDPAWLKARLPGLRNTMAAIQNLENAEGLPVGLPSWTFVDWASGWNHGEAPDGSSRTRPSAVHAFFWVLAQQSAAAAERACGDADQAAYWEKRARRTFDAAKVRFWDEGRGLFADELSHRRWSEHTQCLAILSGFLSEQEEATVFAKLVSAPDLVRTTVYFMDYLFAVYFREGRGDLFLERLDLWRDYIAKGLKTPLESPDGAFGPGKEARSDCHAWGAHPIFHALTGLAGIRSAADGFAKVVVAPSPGSLAFIRAKMPHPRGAICVDLRFEKGAAAGSVSLPLGVTGEFRWKGGIVSLSAGKNEISE